MTNTTCRNTNPFLIQNLGVKSESFKKGDKAVGSNFWNGKKCFKCNPSDQLKMESSSGDQIFSANQKPVGSAKDTKPEETSKFILDYIPLCCEEDLELIAFYFAQDDQKKSS
ncbi:hypothetical protein GCM10009119_11130 [Algoriphagus jejuensis]|uniref:Uncharacterized protein n=1 Tax=Algoriphagus jejuensis TaxID=419934 RepID=A0ABP3YBN3_9BACT